jgi:trans-aconitate 2-methyltransferase
VPNHLPVLDGVKNSLKNQGKLFLQLGGKGNARPIQIATQEVMKRERWCHYFDDFIYKTRFYSDYEYWNLLKKVGLTAQRIELIPKQMIHENREQLIGWLRVVGTPNYVGVLPEELQQLIIAEIVDTYLHCHPPDDEGIIRTPMVRLEVEATKLPSQWNQFY